MILLLARPLLEDLPIFMQIERAEYPRESKESGICNPDCSEVETKRKAQIVNRPS